MHQSPSMIPSCFGCWLFQTLVSWAGCRVHANAHPPQTLPNRAKNRQTPCTCKHPHTQAKADTSTQTHMQHLTEPIHKIFTHVHTRKHTHSDTLAFTQPHKQKAKPIFQSHKVKSPQGIHTLKGESGCKIDSPQGEALIVLHHNTD